ncbi:hypothetical protein MIR68_007470 [Amoeboaphelidium protococcarum]|nr:hypothetical protein MIR68_007470 [Amoeboaphelidium protococcarum]
MNNNNTNDEIEHKFGQQIKEFHNQQLMQLQSIEDQLMGAFKALFATHRTHLAQRVHALNSKSETMSDDIQIVVKDIEEVSVLLNKCAQMLAK